MAADARTKPPLIRRDQIVIWVVMAVLIFGYQWFQNREGRDGVPVRPTPQPPQASATGTKSATKGPSLTRSVVLRDQDGDVIYRGEIDLGPSLERIAATRKLRFPNDGSTFQNREGRLPRKPPGYYTEWVVPTPGESGPGPQRIVLGDDGDVWYTRDHYKSFERIAGGLPAAGPAGAR